MARHSTRLARLPGTAAPPLIPPPASRLRLRPDGTGRGIMDGGWWPRSRDAAAELPELVITLAERLGAATRLTIDFDDWDHVPLRITALRRVIRVGWLPHLDHMVAVSSGRDEPLLLLVIPPGTPRARAEEALGRAAAGTGDTPWEILASCDVSTVIGDHHDRLVR
ncbi:DUF5994 family protein [Actinomadura nitritigenes]|uniref:Uncharacterized protein n=1 Tax=Actinomadura nitritigenes TaxID=134602 RepID=A0ABS3RHG6_9ACTN|nr:DUF5994 family protein [Actinomadura nitritigenes]MBO2445059.1 hypothetical protein [Actinomadura nitritigenes]